MHRRLTIFRLFKMVMMMMMMTAVDGLQTGHQYLQTME